MNLFGIIFYIVIIVIFINAKKAARSDSEHKSRNYHVPNAMKKTIQNTPDILEKAVKSIPNVPKNGKTATPNVPVKRKTDKKFMEPHREEKEQPKIRTNHLWGEDEHADQRIAALRLMEGDPVPEGYVEIKCPYCGAENLVTKHCRQYHSCYFCRVPID